MSEIINFSEHHQRRKDKALREKLIKEMAIKKAPEEADYTFLKILDIFCQKYQPDIYWRFDLFINDKLK